MREQMHVRIVPMTGDHLDEVAELERICFTTPWSRNMLVEELQNDCAAFLVALDDEDHVAGYAGLLVVLDEGYITNVAVRPECRRNGIAQKLLQVFLDFAQAHKLAFLTLEVRASNYGAIALYGSRGFRREDTLSRLVFCLFSYALRSFRCSSTRRSAIMAMNSLLVGLPLALETV